MVYQSISKVDNEDDTSNSFSFDEQFINTEEHTDASYLDTFADGCEEIGGKQQHSTVLANLFDGVALKGFPTLTVTTAGINETYNELLDIFGMTFEANFLGVPQATFRTGIVRRGLLYLPDLRLASYEKETKTHFKQIANRTGLVVTG